MALDIAAALAAASQGLKLVKELREIDRGLDEAGFKLKIAELTEALADVKVTLSEAKMALDDKEAELDGLRKTFARREAETLLRDGMRYLKGADDQPRGNPFCPRCELDGVLIHSVALPAGHQCPRCKASLGRAWTFQWEP